VIEEGEVMREFPQHKATPIYQTTRICCS